MPPLCLDLRIAQDWLANVTKALGLETHLSHCTCREWPLLVISCCLFLDILFLFHRHISLIRRLRTHCLLSSFHSVTLPRFSLLRLFPLAVQSVTGGIDFVFFSLFFF